MCWIRIRVKDKQKTFSCVIQKNPHSFRYTDSRSPSNFVYNESLTEHLTTYFTMKNKMLQFTKNTKHGMIIVKRGINDAAC